MSSLYRTCGFPNSKLNSTNFSKNIIELIKFKYFTTKRGTKLLLNTYIVHSLKKRSLNSITNYDILLQIYQCYGNNNKNYNYLLLIVLGPRHYSQYNI